MFIDYPCSPQENIGQDLLPLSEKACPAQGGREGSEEIFTVTERFPSQEIPLHPPFGKGGNLAREKKLTNPPYPVISGTSHVEEHRLAFALKANIKAVNGFPVPRFP